MIFKSIGGINLGADLGPVILSGHFVSVQPLDLVLLLLYFVSDFPYGDTLQTLIVLLCLTPSLPFFLLSSLLFLLPSFPENQVLVGFLAGSHQSLRQLTDLQYELQSSSTFPSREFGISFVLQK